MLVINRELPIPDADTLEWFKSLLVIGSYDKESERYTAIYSNYLDHIYKIDKELTQEIAEKISPHVIPIVSVNTQEDYELMALDFKIIVDDSGFVLKQKDQMLAEQLMENKYANVKTLLEELLSSD